MNRIRSSGVEGTRKGGEQNKNPGIKIIVETSARNIFGGHKALLGCHWKQGTCISKHAWKGSCYDGI